MNLEISETERLFLIFALGMARGTLGSAQTFYGEQVVSLYDRVVSLKELSAPSPRGAAAADAARGGPLPGSGTEQAKAILAPPPDHGARPAYNPRAAQAEVDFRKDQPRAILWASGKARDSQKLYTTIIGLTRKDSGSKPRLLLKDGTKQFSLWDKNLFDAVASKLNKPWTYYVTHSADGKYTNLVGMEKP